MGANFDHTILREPEKKKTTEEHTCEIFSRNKKVRKRVFEKKREVWSKEGGRKIRELLCDILPEETTLGRATEIGIALQQVVNGEWEKAAKEYEGS
jgi:hypothetical protein